MIKDFNRLALLYKTILQNSKIIPALQHQQILPDYGDLITSL